MTINKNLPTQPRDASTVIIIKRKNEKSFVLMGRRPMSSSFMPGIYVFPGGVLEKEDLDFSRYFKENIFTQINEKKVKTKSSIHTKALLLTAIRETAEETGLYLSKKIDFNLTSSPNLNKTWQKFIYNSFFPDTEKLFFFGRAITPSTLKKRYHARFFIAFYDDFTGKVTTNGELENLEWLSLYEAKEKKVADVTEFMINEIIKFDNNYKALYKKKMFPMFTWRNQKRWIKWDKT